VCVCGVCVSVYVCVCGVCVSVYVCVCACVRASRRLFLFALCVSCIYVKLKLWRVDLLTSYELASRHHEVLE